MNRKAIIVVAALAAFIVVISGTCFLQAGSSPAPAGCETIRVGMPALEQGALIYIAEEQGIFDKNGLHVLVADGYPDGTGPVRDMTEGTLDFSVSAEYPVIASIFDGENISIVATIDKYQNEMLIGRRDHGIAAVSDLRGRKIGLPRGTILEFFLGMLLARNGMHISDVTLVNVGAPDGAVAIESGEVDAVMTFQPHAGRILDLLGDNAISWPGQSDQLLYGVLAARSDWIRDHQDQTGRFLLSLEEARQYSLTHPDEVKETVGRRMNVTGEYVDEVWPDHQFTLSLEQSLLLAMNDEGRWMTGNNMTPGSGVPDFRNNIWTDSLCAIAPRAVNIG